MNTAYAGTLTAVCKEPVGRIHGQQGNIGKNRPVDVPEEIPGGAITVDWNVQDKTARIFVEGAKGTQPLTEEGQVVFGSWRRD